MSCAELVEQQFAVLNHVPVGACVLDREGMVVFWNRCLEDWTGHSAEEMLGRPLAERYPHLRKPKYTGRLEEVFQGGPPIIFSSQLHSHIIPAPLPGGEYRIQHTTILPVRHPGCDDFLALFIIEDVTDLTRRIRDYRAMRDSALEEIQERQRVEEQLRRVHAETHRLLSSITSIMISIDEQGRVTQWNPAAERTFGIPANAVTFRTFEESGIQWDWERFREHLKKCLDTDEHRDVEDIRFTRQGGKDGVLAVSIHPIVHEEGKQAGYLILGMDITERKVLEGRLQQAKKLEAIGQLAAGIAHEINTPTQYTGDNTRFLQDSFGDLIALVNQYGRLLEACKQGQVTPELIEEVERSAEEADIEYLRDEIPVAIEQALEGIDRVADIVRAMKEFSHPGTESRTPTDLNKAIQSTITVARNEWKYVAEVETDFDPELPPVPCFPGDLNQVVLNLIVNAAHAIGEKVGDGSSEKGKIIISTASVNGHAEIRIADTGTGIPPEIADRIYDPFFTTKEVGKGTGQGLALAHSVMVDKHGGSLCFETEQGKGTVFILTLPMEPAGRNDECGMMRDETLDSAVG